MRLSFLPPFVAVVSVVSSLIMSAVCSAVNVSEQPAVPNYPIRQSEVIKPEPYAGMPLSVNPPTFRWPGATGLPVVLTVENGAGEVVLKTEPIDHYYYRPMEPLPTGALTWTLRNTDGDVLATDRFTIDPALKKWPVISGAEAVANIPKSHPRVFIRPENLQAWREALHQPGDHELKRWLRIHGDDYLIPLPEEPELPEVEGVPTRNAVPRQVFWDASEYALTAARGIVNTCLLYQATGESKYAEFVKARALKLAALDPRGLTSHDINDFGNSRIVNALGWAYSWIYDTLSESERATIRSAILERCRIALLTAEKEHWPWPYIPALEYKKAEPHAWQFVNYHLAVGLIAIHGESEEADKWLEWLVNLFVANYPWFSGSDGGSAEQVPYFLGTNLISSQQVVYLLKTATSIDLTGNLWHKNAPYFMLYGFGIGDNTSQFGDNGGRAPGNGGTMVARNAAYQFQDGILAGYYDRLNERASSSSSFLPLLEAPYDLPERESLADLPTSRVFEDVGLVFMRSDIEDPENEIFFEFKSSPFGSIGHGHNDQNSMNLSAFGKILLLDSGFYNYYNSPHHKGWTQTTRAHNSILMNGTGQPYNTMEYYGRIVDFKDNAESTYVVGDAHRAYDQVKLKRFDRHVLWLKPDIFLVADDIESSEAIDYQFMLHAKNAFEIDGNEIWIHNDPAHAKITFVEPNDLKISQTDQFLMPLEEITKRPNKANPEKQWHLTAETSGKSTIQRFITLIEVSKTGEAKEAHVQVDAIEGGVSIKVSDGREGQILWRTGDTD